MFDIGFSEMVVIAVVALIVIGPERLPGVARTAGALLGRIQRYFNDVKSEVNRELQLDDIRKMQQELADKARNLERSAQEELAAVEQEIESAQAALAGSTEQPAAFQAITSAELPGPGSEPDPSTKA